MRKVPFKTGNTLFAEVEYQDFLNNYRYNKYYVVQYY